jgi:peptidoglycan hydrolase-like protein with peptidoglycan-binding domain
MAHREAISNEELAMFLDGGSFYWAISSNVGYSCRNRLEDVQLVQFFLNCIFDGKRKEGFSSRKNLVVDGKFGGKTWSAIKWFQKDYLCVADGMVSAAGGKDNYTPKHGKAYTIHWLNSSYSYYHRQYYKDIRMHPGLPTELCSQLSGPLPDLV